MKKPIFIIKREPLFLLMISWKSIIKYLEMEEKPRLDLIVMPESVVPFTAHAAIYSYEEVKRVLGAVWGRADDFNHLLISDLLKRASTREKNAYT